MKKFLYYLVVIPLGLVYAVVAFLSVLILIVLPQNLMQLIRIYAAPRDPAVRKKLFTHSAYLTFDWVNRIALRRYQKVDPEARGSSVSWEERHEDDGLVWTHYKDFYGGESMLCIQTKFGDGELTQ